MLTSLMLLFLGLALMGYGLSTAILILHNTSPQNVDREPYGVKELVIDVLWPITYFTKKYAERMDKAIGRIKGEE